MRLKEAVDVSTMFTLVDTVSLLQTVRLSEAVDVCIMFTLVDAVSLLQNVSMYLDGIDMGIPSFGSFSIVLVQATRKPLADPPGNLGLEQWPAC